MHYSRVIRSQLYALNAMKFTIGIHSPIGEKLNGKCEECGSKKYTEWDYESKKCPKCKDGIIDESDEGMVVMAD